MLIATWNLNNRVGKVRFRPEAASAAIALGADVLVFNEYYPKDHEPTFVRTLRDAGWPYQEKSKDTGEIANRVLIASRLPLEPLDIRLPDFDRQFPSNVLCVGVPSAGVSIVGVRVPWYNGKDVGLVVNAWDWLESTAAALLNRPSIILGDLNAELKSNRSRGGEHLRRILQSGWHRAAPKETASYFGNGGQHAQIDHILGTDLCGFGNARYVTELDGHLFAGGKGAISDHAALLAEVTLLSCKHKPASGITAGHDDHVIMDVDAEDLSLGLLPPQVGQSSHMIPTTSAYFRLRGYLGGLWPSGGRGRLDRLSVGNGRR